MSGSLSVRPEQPATSDAYDAVQDSGRAYGEHGNRSAPPAPVWDEELDRWRPAAQQAPNAASAAAFGALVAVAASQGNLDLSALAAHIEAASRAPGNGAGSGEEGAAVAALLLEVALQRSNLPVLASLRRSDAEGSEDENIPAWAASLIGLVARRPDQQGLPELRAIPAEGEDIPAWAASLLSLRARGGDVPTLLGLPVGEAQPAVDGAGETQLAIDWQSVASAMAAAPPPPPPPPLARPAPARTRPSEQPRPPASGRTAPPSAPRPVPKAPPHHRGAAPGLEDEEARFLQRSNALDRRPAARPCRPAAAPSRPPAQPPRPAQSAGPRTTMAGQGASQGVRSAPPQPRSAPPRGTHAGIEDAERRFLGQAAAADRKPSPPRPAAAARPAAPARPVAGGQPARPAQPSQPARPAAPAAPPARPAHPARPAAPPPPRGTHAGIESAEARFLGQAAATDRRPPRPAPAAVRPAPAAAPSAPPAGKPAGGWVSVGADVLRDEAAGIRRPPARATQIDAWVATRLNATDPGWFNSAINQEQAALRQALTGGSELGALTERELRYLLDRATRAWERNFGTGPAGHGVRTAIDFAASLAQAGDDRLAAAAADVMARRAASLSVAAEVGAGPSAVAAAEAYAQAAVEAANARGRLAGGYTPFNARGVQTMLGGLTDEEAARLGGLLADAAERGGAFGPGRDPLAYALAAAGGMDQSRAADAFLRGALGGLDSEAVAAAVDQAVAMEAGLRPRAAEAFARGAAELAQGGEDALRAGSFADAALRYAADGIAGGRAADAAGLRALFAALSDDELAGLLEACAQGVRLEALRDQLGESVLAAIDALNGGDLAAIGRGAAPPDAREMGIAAALAFQVPAETVAAVNHPHAAEAVAIALARLLEPPTDTAAVAGTAAHLASILGTAQGRELLLISDALAALPAEASTALRQQILGVLDARRDIDARMLAQAESGFACAPLVAELARPRADAFAALADQLRLAGPMRLDGPELANLIGFTLGLPAAGTTADPAQLLAGGADLYGSGPYAAQVARVAETIRFLGGERAQVIPVAVQVAGRQFGMLQTTVFQVRDANGETWIVDANGERYRSLDAWRSANDLPPGLMTYAAGGEQIRGEDGHVALTTEATPGTVDTFAERAVQVVDGVMLVGGVVATGALIVGTGGVAGVVLGGVAVASAAWAGGRSAVNLHQRLVTGQELNPFVSAEARADWLNLAASVAGAGAMRAGLVAAQAAQVGRATPAMLRAAGMWEAAANALDAASMVDGGIAIAQAWDQMSVSDRMLALLGPAFWAGGVTHNAGGLREVASSPTRLFEQFTPGGVEAGLARHAPGLALPDFGLDAPAGPRSARPNLADATPGRVIAAEPGEVVIVRDGFGKPFAVGTRGPDGAVDPARLEPHDAAGVARALGLPEGSRVVVADRQVVMLSPDAAAGSGGWRAQTLSPDDPAAKPLVEALAPMIRADTRSEQRVWREIVREAFGVEIPAEPAGRAPRAPVSADPPPARPGEVLTRPGEEIAFVRDGNGKITHFAALGPDGRPVTAGAGGDAPPIRPAKGEDLRDLLGLPAAAKVFASADGYTVLAPQRVRRPNGEEGVEVVAQVVRPSERTLYELVGLLAAEQGVAPPRIGPIAAVRDGLGLNAELRLSLGASEPLNREMLVRGQTGISLDTLDILLRHLGEPQPKLSPEVIDEAVGLSAKTFNVRDPDLFRKGLFTLPYGNATAIDFKLDALQRFAVAAAGEQAAGAEPSQPFRFNRIEEGTDETGAAWVKGRLELNVAPFDTAAAGSASRRDAFGNPLRPGVTYFEAKADIPLSKVTYEDTYALLGFSVSRKIEPTTKFTISKGSVLPAEFVDNINRTFSRLEVRLTEAVPSFVGELPAATPGAEGAPRWQRTAEHLFPVSEVGAWPEPFGPSRLPPHWVKVDITPQNQLLDSGLISVSAKPGTRLHVEGRLPAEAMGVSIRFAESDVMRTALREVLGVFGLRPFLNERVPGIGAFSASSFFDTAIAGRGPRSLYDAIVGTDVQGTQTTREIQLSFAPLSLKLQVDALAGLRTAFSSVLPSFLAGDWAAGASSLTKVLGTTFSLKAPGAEEAGKAFATLWKPRLDFGALGDSLARFPVFNLLAGEVSLVFTRAGMGSFRGSADHVAPEAGPNAVALVRVSAEGGRFLGDAPEAGVVIEVPAWLVQAGRNDFASVPRGGSGSLEAMLRERMALTPDPARRAAIERFLAEELQKLVKDGEALTTAKRTALLDHLVALGAEVPGVADPLRLSPHAQRLAALAGAAGGEWTEAGIARVKDWLAMAAAAPDAALRAIARAAADQLALAPPRPGATIGEAQAALIGRLIAADRDSFATGAWQVGPDPGSAPAALHRLVAGGPLLWIHDVYDERRFAEGEAAGAFAAVERVAQREPATGTDGGSAADTSAVATTRSPGGRPAMFGAEPEDWRAPAAPASPPAPLPPAEHRDRTAPVHVVVAGDTLGAIAARHGVRLADLIAANPQIVNPDLIHPGDVITLPPSRLPWGAP